MKSQEKNKPLSKNLIIISMLNLITGILLNISTAKPNCKIILYIYWSKQNLKIIKLLLEQIEMSILPC